MFVRTSVRFAALLVLQLVLAQVAGAQKTVILPAGTVVLLEPLGPVFPEPIVIGQTLDYRVRNAVVRNEKIIIPAGTWAQVQVTNMVRSNEHRATKVYLEARSAQAVDGQTVVLQAMTQQVMLFDSASSNWHVPNLLTMVANNLKVRVGGIVRSLPPDSILAKSSLPMPCPSKKSGRKKGKKLLLQAGTLVVFETIAQINSLDMYVGQPVQLRVVSDIVTNGRTVLRSGTGAWGRIKSIEPATVNTHERIRFEAEIVQAVDGTYVPLFGQEMTISSDYPSESVAAAPGVFCAGVVQNNVKVRAK